MTPTPTEAFAPEWELLRGLCVREARRILRRHEDAEDAAQEAMIRAWRNSGQCRDPTVVPWVLQISRNEAHRLAARRARFEPELSPARTEPATEDPRMARVPLTHSVRDAVGRLAPDDQLLLGLRYGADLTQVQLAEMLGQPEGTIKVRLHRARRRVGELLGDAD